MGFGGVRELAQSLDDDGASWTSYFFKSGGPASFGGGAWADLSMGAGTPKYNAYVGVQFEATQRFGVGNDGIFTGPVPAAGQTKHLAGMSVRSNSTTLAPALFLLCDYLLFYPLVDGDDTAQQDLVNTVGLPRYESGHGVQLMVVCTTPNIGGATITINYTNQAGVPGRTATVRIFASTVVGTILSAGNNSGAANSRSPFIPLANGDTGVRSVESVTLASPLGGFFALVLVHPLASLQLREANTASEVQMVPHRGGVLPEVLQGAYLNLIYLTAQSGTPVPLLGSLDFAWR